MRATSSGSRWTRSPWCATLARSCSTRPRRPTESAWDFVALGEGHDTAFCAEFLRTLHEVDPDMAVNIEHADVSLGRIEDLEIAAQVLKNTDAVVGATLEPLSASR